MRKDVKTLTFQSSLQNVPSSAWDVSEAGDRSVLAWMDNGDLYVAADGAIAPNSDASWLFQDFVNLKTIDFGDCFVTSNVTNTIRYVCRLRTVSPSWIYPGFDTSSVKYMYGDVLHAVASLTQFGFRQFRHLQCNRACIVCFNDCSSLTGLDLSGFDTSSVTSMYIMFYGCESLTHLNLTSFDTSKVTNMDFMFSRMQPPNQLGSQ